MRQLFSLYSGSLLPQSVVEVLFSTPTSYRIPARWNEEEISSLLDSNCNNANLKEDGIAIALWEEVKEAPENALTSTDRQAGDVMMALAARVLVDVSMDISSVCSSHSSTRFLFLFFIGGGEGKAGFEDVLPFFFPCLHLFFNLSTIIHFSVTVSTCWLLYLYLRISLPLNLSISTYF